MRILVITSCTGEKAVKHERALTLDDFRQGAEHVTQRESELAEFRMRADELYTGQQHARLMRGIRALNQAQASNGSGPQVDLWILSAGYGLVRAGRELVPYECTFQGMKKTEIREWADNLRVPCEIRRLLAQSYDLAPVLLGDSYLEACSLDDTVHFGSPRLLFCGSDAAKRLPQLAQLRVVKLSNDDTRRFSCGLVGLKGELGARILRQIVVDDRFACELMRSGADVLTLLKRARTAGMKPRLYPPSAVLAETWVPPGN